MKKIVLLIILSLISFIAGWSLKKYQQPSEFTETFISQRAPDLPLEKYAIEKLSRTKILTGKLEIEDIIKENDKHSSHLFNFEFNPDLKGKSLKKTTGQINIPNGEGPFPLIIMLRGYVDQELYKTGDGTRRAAEVFAENGYITIAPDFLGYANSSLEAENIFEARFQTYTTVLSLIESLEQPSFTEATESKWNKKDIFLWGHSNGGQIALTILEITGANYPTTLWAPVSKPFPYSILYYTDESEDKGKLIRQELAKFEELYDVEKYSLDNYFEKINAPLQIHQGSGDDAVPQNWSDQLVRNLEKQEVGVTYHTYSGADHNMRPVWNTVVKRDIEFFNKHKR
jgi:dienelactone hydrolase